MNACGQHNMSQIGFQGMSIKTKDNKVAPAVQILLGGSNLGNGSGKFADKVIKLPSKRGPQASECFLMITIKTVLTKSYLQIIIKDKKVISIIY